MPPTQIKLSGKVLHSQSSRNQFHELKGIDVYHWKKDADFLWDCHRICQWIELWLQENLEGSYGFKTYVEKHGLVVKP
jgi:hypothetical protein